jgi:hypothetical protein
MQIALDKVPLSKGKKNRKKEIALRQNSPKKSTVKIETDAPMYLKYDSCRIGDGSILSY